MGLKILGDNLKNIEKKTEKMWRTRTEAYALWNVENVENVSTVLPSPESHLFISPDLAIPKRMMLNKRPEWSFLKLIQSFYCCDQRKMTSNKTEAMKCSWYQECQDL